MKHLCTLFMFVVVFCVIAGNDTQAANNNYQLFDMQNVDCWSFAIDWMEDIESKTGLFYTLNKQQYF